MKYDVLISGLHGFKQNWKIELLNLSDVKVVDSRPDFPSPEETFWINTMKEFIKKSGVMPPILVNDKNIVLDGRKRHLAYTQLETPKIAVIKSVGEGDGSVVHDEVYADKKGSFINIPLIPLPIIWAEEQV